MIKVIKHETFTQVKFKKRKKIKIKKSSNADKRAENIKCRGIFGEPQGHVDIETKYCVECFYISF